jgi:alpha-glucosidase
VKNLFDMARRLDKEALRGAVAYPLRQRYYQARHPQGSSKPRSLAETLVAMFRRGTVAPAARRPLGSVESYLHEGQVIDLVTRDGVLRIEVLAEDLVRIRLRAAVPAEVDEPPLSYALDPGVEWPPTSFQLEADDEQITIRTDQVTVRLERLPCRLTFLDAAGQPISESAQGIGFLGEGAFWTRRLTEGEAIYGLAEKAFDLNLRGRRLELWNTDPHCYHPGDDPLNLCIPMMVGLREGRAYGLFFDNPGRAFLDLGQTQPDELRYEACQGELCAYFFGGPTVSAVLERYTQLTGRMPLPPRWMLGYQQSRWSYYPEEQVRDLAAQFRQRRIPCDVIHLDIHYMDGYRIFTWDGERFPDPARLLADLRNQGFRVITIIDPGVKVDPGYEVYDKGLSRDAYCKRPDGTVFKGPVWPGDCAFPDFTDGGVRDWWGELYRSLLEAGVSGIWNDMNEPAIFVGGMPENVRHSYEGRGATHGEIHNVYGLQMARATAEGLRRLRPGERVPVISRAGYAGLQRYALVWTADNYSTWAHLRLGVSMCLNLGLSGVALCGPDIGGFAGDCGGELLVRWTQVGALTPFFRNHSAADTRRQEPWAFGEPYESICRRWIELRTQLLPYIYTAAWQASQTGLPMMRPLSLAYPDDRRTYNLDDQFLFGDALLAAPVGRPGQTSRHVYLPGGAWYDFWSGERLSGEVKTSTPLERMPVYVRAGSVLPIGPVLQHTDEWPPDTLILHIYLGAGESWLYEDDGHSLAFQSGEFQRTRFVCQARADGWVVRREVEGPFEPGYDRFEIQIHGLDKAPKQVLLDGQRVEDLQFDAESRMVGLLAGPWAKLEIL